ncbi:DUF4829 domain-containing protein [Psychroflexus sediminis]|uniref:Lumazine-binding n=1 Tax=Psychroflexus sediminis TaxID=470826 RepID=A0A1G7VGA0_9FLAO|nr:DUF4829 domain-containing protein [Psychroflexus sediminis]SDG58598.1 hypothetical protein SAMN04488027_103286 [Psychroflexus sediminis]
MKKAISIAVLLFFSSWQIHAQTADEVVDSFFEALNSKDHQTLGALCLDDMQLHTLSLSDEIVLNSQSKQGFIEGVKSIPEETEIFEKIISKESIVTEHLAQYTLPYSFYVNDKRSHTGINVISLLKTKQGWKISYIADTRKKS